MKIKTILLFSLFLISQILFADTLHVNKVSGSDSAAVGQKLEQVLEVTQADTYDQTKINSITIETKTPEQIVVVQDATSPCVSAAPISIGNDHAQACRFKLEIEPRFGSISQTISVSNPAFKLTFNDNNPVIVDVGATKLLQFSLQNPTHENIHIEALHKSFEDDSFIVMPDSDCENATLNVDTKESCKFTLSYTPKAEGDKHIDVIIQALDALQQETNSNVIKLELQAKVINTPLRLSYQGENPVSNNVGVSKILDFKLDNTANTNIQLGLLSNNIKDSEFSIVPGNNCDDTILNAETKSSCSFMLKYTPKSDEARQLTIVIPGLDPANKLIESNPVNLMLQAKAKAPLMLSYQGEMPLNIIGNDDVHTMSFTLTSQNTNPIEVNDINFETISNNCNKALLRTGEYCKFVVDANVVKADSFDIQANGLDTLNKTEIDSNDIKIPINNSHVSVSPSMYEKAPASRTLGDSFNYELTNSTSHNITVQVNGVDSETNIQLSAGMYLGNVNILNLNDGSPSNCNSPDLMKRHYLVPANSSCSIFIRASCKRNPNRDVNDGPTFANSIDDCYNKFSPTQINYDSPISGRDFEMELKNIVNNKVVNTFGFKMKFSD